MGKSSALGSEKVSKLLLKLSTPAIIAMLVSAIYNLVDTFFVGMLGTNSALGAVSIAFPIFMIITAVGQTLGVGSSAYISRLLGGKKVEDANEIATVSVITSFIIGIVITIIGLIFIDEILLLTGARGDLLSESKSYLHYIVLGTTFTIVNMTLNNIIRAEGAATYSMFALMLGAVLNVVLDPILIFHFNMGVAGASLATTIAQMVSTAFLISFYLLKKGSISITLNYFKPRLAMYKEIVVIGLPSFARQALASLALSVVNITVIPFGEAAVASIGIILRVSSLGSYVLFGIAQGLQPIVAYNYGAKDYKRVKEAVKYALIGSSIFCISLTVIFIMFAKQVVSIFSKHPEVLELGSKTLSIMFVLFVVNGFQTIITTLFQSLGQGKRAFILAASRQGIFFLPAMLFIPKLLGYYGIPISIVIADFCAFILTFILYNKLRKELRENARSIVA